MSIPKVPSKFNVTDSDKEVLPQDSISNHCHCLPVDLAVYFTLQPLPLPSCRFSCVLHSPTAAQPTTVDSTSFLSPSLPYPPQWTQPISSLRPSPSHHNGLNLFPLSAPPQPTTVDSTSFLPNPPQSTQPLSTFQPTKNGPNNLSTVKNSHPPPHPILPNHN